MVKKAIFFVLVILAVFQIGRYWPDLQKGEDNSIKEEAVFQKSVKAMAESQKKLDASEKNLEEIIANLELIQEAQAKLLETPKPPPKKRITRKRIRRKKHCDGYFDDYDCDSGNPDTGEY